MSAKVELRVVEECKLGAEGWGALFPGGDKRSQEQGQKQGGGQKVADESTRSKLLKVLLEVYMKGGWVCFTFDTQSSANVGIISESSSHPTARLLNSQAINLDIIDV